MKKLMIAMAAMTAGVAMADIVSSSVVGYQQNASTGYKMITPAFTAIGSETYNLDNLVVVGAGDMEANIQIMDADGKWTGQYFWYNEFTDPDTGDFYPAGWLDNDGNSAGTIKPGFGVYFFTNVEGVKIQSAGEVPGERTIPAPVGYSMVGNSSPVSVNADSLVVTGAGDMEANIQLMDADGKWTGQYFWYNEFTDPDTGDFYPAGWLDNDGNSAGEIGAGDAAYFFTNVSNVKVTIPAAL